MNPMNFLQLKTALERFKQGHPKFMNFVKTASREGVMDEGTVVEIHVTTADGKTISSNIRVRGSDLEFLRALKDLVK